MNHRLLAALFAAPDAWCWEPADPAVAAAPRLRVSATG
jgi:hypothetical protein